MLAVAQMTSTHNLDDNVRMCGELIATAKARGAAMVVLPECFAFMGSGDGDTLRIAGALTAADGDDTLFARYRALAATHGIWVSFGGFAEKRAGMSKAYNSHVVVNDRGEIVSVYRKIHLFDVDLPDRKYRESDAIVPGAHVVTTPSPTGILGLSVCYDVRFPELYRKLADAGADTLLVPAAFTLITGKEHWEVLLRARAIENQCYVAAAAQTGRHNDKRDTYGHAMIIDPWGTVVAQCSDGSGVAVAPIDSAFVSSVRARMPVRAHRRL
jgi:deaminated glutathione amidase